MDNERKGLPSASEWHSLESCNGRYLLSLEAERLGQVAHRVSSPEAAAGDRIHARLAGSEVDLSESESETAKFLEARSTEQIERIFGLRDQVKIEREQRLWMTLDGEPALSGRFDLVASRDGTALIQDFKSGFSEPDPADQNSQLKVLAVLYAIKHRKIHTVIVQIISGPYGVTEGRYQVADLAFAYDDIVQTLRAINSEHASFNPSPEACRYCPAKLICQAVKDTILPIAKLQVSLLPEGEKAARLLDEIGLLRGHFDQIEEYYWSRASDDPSYQIPGYALVPGIVRREVIDWPQAQERLKGYLDEQALSGALSYRLVELERALGKALKLKGAPLKDKMNEILSGLIEQKQNKASLRRIKNENQIGNNHRAVISEHAGTT